MTAENAALLQGLNLASDQKSTPTGGNNSDAYVSFQKVQKSYDGEILVVKDLNLDIAQGEFVTMLGPSGSGKTTLLKHIALSFARGEAKQRLGWQGDDLLPISWY